MQALGLSHRMPWLAWRLEANSFRVRWAQP